MEDRVALAQSLNSILSGGFEELNPDQQTQSVFAATIVARRLLQLSSGEISDPLDQKPMIDLDEQICRLNAVMVRQCVNHIKMRTMTEPSNTAKDCGDKIREAAERGLDRLGEAKSAGERVDAIRDWGRETKEAVRDCVDKTTNDMDTIIDP